MNKAVITTNSPGAIGPYSQALMTSDYVFTSGQIPLLTNGELLEGSIEEQTHQVMKNLRGILEASNVSFKDVAKTTIYLTEMSDFKNVNEVYKSYFSEPYPARETVCVKELPLGAKLEISMTASRN